MWKIKGRDDSISEPLSIPTRPHVECYRLTSCGIRTFRERAADVHVRGLQSCSEGATISSSFSRFLPLLQSSRYDLRSIKAITAEMEHELTITDDGDGKRKRISRKIHVYGMTRKPHVKL